MFSESHAYNLFNQKEDILLGKIYNLFGWMGRLLKLVEWTWAFLKLIKIIGKFWKDIFALLITKPRHTKLKPFTPRFRVGRKKNLKKMNEDSIKL